MIKYTIVFTNRTLKHITRSADTIITMVLTIVFGMGTGVSPERIATENILLSNNIHILCPFPLSIPLCFISRESVALYIYFNLFLCK